MAVWMDEKRKNEWTAAATTTTITTTKIIHNEEKKRRRKMSGSANKQKHFDKNNMYARNVLWMLRILSYFSLLCICMLVRLSSHAHIHEHTLFLSSFSYPSLSFTRGGGGRERVSSIEIAKCFNSDLWSSMTHKWNGESQETTHLQFSFQRLEIELNWIIHSPKRKNIFVSSGKYQ